MKKAIITLVFLIVLTIVSALLSTKVETYVGIGLIVLAALKFIAVSFYFMELKQANTFWKGSVLFFLICFTAAVLIIFHN